MRGHRTIPLSDGYTLSDVIFEANSIQTQTQMGASMDAGAGAGADAEWTCVCADRKDSFDTESSVSVV